jgi:hypothetical protein
MADDDWIERKFETLRIFGRFAMAGGALLIVGVILQLLIKEDSAIGVTILIVGSLLWVPWFIYMYLLTIWHWKHRYKGRHSSLWGALLLIETSGWFKIVYWFRHIIPDWTNSGRYYRTEVSPEGPTEVGG